MARQGIEKTRLLVAGVGPVPPEATDRLYAPGLRVWGMAHELARAGHPVRLIERLFGASGDATIRIFDLIPENLGYVAASTLTEGSAALNEPPLPAAREVDVSDEKLPALLREEALAFHAAAAIGSTDVINHALAASTLEIPLWFDFFGDPMAERQMLARANQSDEGLAAQWALYAPALARADRVSGCSTEQAAALLGQLGAVGRLNQYTVETALTQVLKPWLTPLKSESVADKKNVFRGRNGAEGFPQDAFVVIQTGGFNTWLDHETLFAALELAMTRDSRLHFAATGGAIAGHYSAGFEAFAARVANSQYTERYHLLGWLPLNRLPHLFAEVDAALNVDLPCPEGRLGTRNRLLDWALAGLPVLSTPGCPLAEELAPREVVELVPHGNPQAIADSIVSLIQSGSERRAQAQSAILRLQTTFAPRVCLQPLLNWAAQPQRAPDLQAWMEGRAAPPMIWQIAAQTQAAERERRNLQSRAAWLERRLKRLEGSRWVRLALKLRGGNDLDRFSPPTESGGVD